MMHGVIPPLVLRLASLLLELDDVTVDPVL